MKRTLTSCILLLLVSLRLDAYWQYPVNNYFQKDYASGTQNWQIAEQKNGWIYLANNYGLLEFDGYSWQTYGLWNSTAVRSVEIGSDGTIYVGGSNEFGKYEAGVTGLLHYTPLSLELPANEKSFGEVWKIHAMSGKVYFQTDHSIFIWSEGKIDRIASQTRITGSCRVREALYVSTLNGLFVLSGRQFIALNGSEQLPAKEICALTSYRNNSLLIGTSFSGIYLFDGTRVRRFATEADGFITSNQLFSIAVGKNYMAFGTVQNGLAVSDLEGKRCRYVNNVNGLQNNTIISLLFDRQDNLWLGLDNGIDYVAINSPLQHLYGNLNFKGAGYCSLIDGKEIYLGTNQGLYYSSYPFVESERLTSLSLVANSQGQVWKLRKFNDRLYCCHNRGLFEVRGNRCVPVLEQEGVWDVRPLSPTEVLVCTYTSLYIAVLDASGIHSLRLLGRIERASHRFEVDALGRILTLTEKGLERITINPQRTAFTTEIIVPSYQPQDYFGMSMFKNRLVVNSAWMFRRADSSGTIVPDSLFADQNLAGVRLYADIQTDEEENLWMAIDNSLAFREYDRSLGRYSPKLRTLLKESYFYIGGFVKLNPIGNRQAIVGNVHGFALVDAHKGVDQELSRPIIRRLILSVPKDSVVYGEYFQSQPSEKQIKIAYSNNSIRLIFGKTMNMTSGGQYSYRLDPIDSEWSAWSEASVKEYTHLKEGSYTFRLRLDNGQETPEAVVRFEILPPWYRTIWMTILYLILLLGLSYLIYIRIRKRYEEGKRRIEESKDEEIRRQEKHFREEVSSRENEILNLKSRQLEYELKVKSQELSNMVLTQININEILGEVKSDLKKIQIELTEKHVDQANRKLLFLQSKLTRNIEYSIDWTKFEENFDIVNDNFLKKLSERYPWLNKNERKLCVYIKIGLLTKEIAPLMNLSTRGVEMLRYRMRKKMELDRQNDLQEFFQLLSKEDGSLEKGTV